MYAPNHEGNYETFSHWCSEPSSDSDPTWRRILYDLCTRPPTTPLSSSFGISRVTDWTFASTNKVVLINAALKSASITPQACVCTEQPCADPNNNDSARPSVWLQASCHLISTQTQQPTLQLACCHFLTWLLSSQLTCLPTLLSGNQISASPIVNEYRAALGDSHFLCCQRHIEWIQSANTNSLARGTLCCLSEALHWLVMDNSESFLSFSNYFLSHFCSAGWQRRRDGTQQRSRRRTCRTSTGITFITFASICSRK